MPYYETDHLQDLGVDRNMTVKQIGWKGVDWINIAVISHLMNHRFPQNSGNFLINPLNTKRRLLYLKTQFVPRSKHFSSQL